MPWLPFVAEVRFDEIELRGFRGRTERQNRPLVYAMKLRDQTERDVFVYGNAMQQYRDSIAEDDCEV